jgi:putative peptidoglycan lipid II flippase
LALFVFAQLFLTGPRLSDDRILVGYNVPRRLMMRLQFFKAARADSTNRKIFHAALTVALLGVFAKTGLAVKELIVARSFGRSDTLDAFLIALLLPSFVMNLLMSALGASLVPVLIEIRLKESKDEAAKLLSSVLFLSVGLLSAAAILLGLFARFYLPYLGSSFSPAKLLLTRRLLYALLPFVVFGGIAAFLSVVLNAREKFIVPALVPLLTPLVIIVFVVSTRTTWGSWPLAAGTALGSVLEGMILVYVLKSQGIRLNLKWNGLDVPLRRVLGQYVPMLAGSFLMGGATVVDQSMAAMLPAGSVSALGYANKVTSAIMAIVATGLSTAALPYFSQMVVEKDWQGCRHTLKRYTAIIAVATLPLTLVLIAFSRPLVRLLFQRGAFTAADTELVSRVLICYSLQIPFFIGGAFLVRFLSAMRRNDMLMYATIVSLVLDIILNLVLMRRWGIAGIALSTSLVYATSFLFVAICSWLLLSRKLVSRPSRPANAQSRH